MRLFFISRDGADSNAVHYIVEYIGFILGMPVFLSSDSQDLLPTDIVIEYLPFDKINQISVNHLYIADSGFLYNRFTPDGTFVTRQFNDFEVPVPNEFIFESAPASISDSECTVDLLSVLFYHLTRFEEFGRTIADEQPEYHRDSVLFRYGGLQIPHVDVLVDYLLARIRSYCLQNTIFFTSIDPFPAGEPFGFFPTHDVDIVRGVSLPNQVKAVARILFSYLRLKPQAAQKIAANLELDNLKGWNFPELLEFYRKHNIRASFFFLARASEKFKYRYQIASSRFRALFSSLLQSGHEVALHPSRFASEFPGRYHHEKHKLEMSAQTRISGARQHYLRALYPTLWHDLGKNGLQYDSSIGYNHHYGFRAGTCRPFPVFDHFQNERIDLFEFPLSVFENNIEISQDHVRDTDNLIDTILNFRGISVPLLHPSNYSKPEWKQWWNYLIESALHRKPASMTLTELNNWLRWRSKIKIEIKSNSKFTIILPDTHHTFVLRSLPGTEFTTKSCTISRLSDNRYLFAPTTDLISVSFTRAEV